MLNNDFSSSVEYDFDRSYNCEENGCNQEGICKCSTICSTKILDVNLQDLTNNIYNQFQGHLGKNQKRDSKISTILYGGEVVDKYCIYRILVYLKTFSTDLWNVEIRAGYYGEEIGSIYLSDLTFLKLEQHIEKIFELESLDEKLKYCLSVEYGYLLTELEEAQFELISIYKTDIDFKKLNQKHIQDCKQEDLSHYFAYNYALPRGIVKKYSDTYTIVDGYHRILATDQKAFEVFLVKE